MEDYSQKAFYFVIKVYNNRELIDMLQWRNLRMDTRMKWDWYFKYRAALLQVKYPKARVETAWGTEDASGKTAQQLHKHKISRKMAVITKYKNRLNEYKRNWNSLFPIEDDFVYVATVTRIAKLEKELGDLISKIDKN